jgi:hypothetical protein
LEFAALIVALASAGIGGALRKYLSAKAGVRLFVVGLTVLLLGVASYALMFAGWISMWIGAGLLLLCLGLATLLLPLSLILCWPRR